MTMSKYKLFDFDTTKFPFKETVEKMMDVDQLDMIHQVFKFPEKLEIIKDQNTILHDKFYEEMKKEEFTQLYRGFVKEFIGFPAIRFPRDSHSDRCGLHTRCVRNPVAGTRISQTGDLPYLHAWKFVP